MSTTISQRQFDFSNKGKGIIAKKAIIGGELIGISVPTPDWATNGTLETPYQFSLKLRDGTEGKDRWHQDHSCRAKRQK